MLTSFKDKLITNVSKISLLNSSPNTQRPNQTTNVDLYVGAAILTYFQKSWAELHEINESNANSAALLAENINKVHESIIKEHKNITKIDRLLNTPPVLDKCIKNCLVQMKYLDESFQNTEKALVNLEDIIDELEFELTKSDYLNSMISQRKKDEAARLVQSAYEEQRKQEKISAERQQVFEEAFNNDLEIYKTLGAIPKIETKTQPSALLEEIQLDLDENDLETFLSNK